MIALARKQGDNRLMAVLLFVIAVILVYVVCFHWFILRHLDYNDRLDQPGERCGIVAVPVHGRIVESPK